LPRGAPRSFPTRRSSDRIRGTFPARAAAFEARQQNQAGRLPWRRLTTDYTSPLSGETYLFIYRIPNTELHAWHRDSLFWPLSALDRKSTRLNSSHVKISY